MVPVTSIEHLPTPEEIRRQNTEIANRYLKETDAYRRDPSWTLRRVESNANGEAIAYFSRADGDTLRIELYAGPESELVIPAKEA